MSLVQYIILRKDLASKWTKGANIAQACHAVTKCLMEFKDDELVKQYTSPENLNQMAKIILEVADEEALSKLKIALKTEGIQFVEWIELPENIITSIVLKPCPKTQVSDLLIITLALEYSPEDLRMLKKIFIGGLNNKTTERAIRLYFERYGAVESVILICDSSNKSKGYGFVIFEDPASVKEVLSKIHVIDLRQIDVKEPI